LTAVVHAKLLISLVFYCLSAVVMACPSNGDVNSFLKFRAQFIDASLQGKAEVVVDFYHFPLFGGGAHDKDKDLKFTRDTFMKVYDVLFVETARNGAPTIFRNLRGLKQMDPSFVSNIALPNGCLKEDKLKNGIHEPDYAYHLIGGNWKVTRVSIADGYEDALDELKSRKIKPW
jgi:hypothetical protein